MQIVAFYKSVVPFSTPKLQLCHRFDVWEWSRQCSENEIIRRVSANREGIKLQFFFFLNMFRVQTSTMNVQVRRQEVKNV